jgi:hypothetical protein
MKNGVFWDVKPHGSCRTDVSEGLSASFIRVTRIGELGTTLAVTSNRHTLRRNTMGSYRLALCVIKRFRLILNVKRAEGLNTSQEKEGHGGGGE